MKPIIADADCGHGGNHAVMRLTKLFIEAGVAGIHMEDQNQSTKKCGHMGGKVLVSTQTHIDRSLAARLQADIMNVPLVIVARTDAEAATQLDNNSDPRDHQFILGSTNPNLDRLAIVLQDAATKGQNIGNVQKKWRAEANLMTFWEAVESKLAPHGLRKWRQLSVGMDLTQARKLATQMGVKVFWCMDAPRSREGYYQIKSGLKMCIARGRAFSPYCDLLWMETKKPGIKTATAFANAIKSVHPNQYLCYNLSPSFNWDACGMTDEELGTYQTRLGKLGYVWQFITLAGFHFDSLACDRFARNYAKDYMLAYVRDIQRCERNENRGNLNTSKWS
eukprot:UN29365